MDDLSDLSDLSKQLILIIDDSKESLHYLCDIFKDYRKAVTSSGTDGIKMANKLKPDLILLDILMPEIDGFEVCRRIKENPENKDIPIIFLSGKTLLEDVVKGFRFGAVDYITKPYENEELMVRVKNNLELKASKDMIKHQNQIMEQLNLELKNFLNIATHDLKNSLLVIQGFLKIILDYKDKFTEEEKLEMLTDISMTSESMYKIITNLLLVTKLEANEISPYPANLDISNLLNESVNFYRTKADLKNINIIQINKIRQEEILQDYTLVKECVDNILSNAVKFSPRDSTVYIRSYSESANIHKIPKIIIEVEDEGPGIKKTEFNLLYKKFSKMSSLPTNKELTTGLGLAITKMIVELLDGSIEFESRIDKGTKFILKFPANLAKQPNNP